MKTINHLKADQATKNEAFKVSKVGPNLIRLLWLTELLDESTKHLFAKFISKLILIPVLCYRRTGVLGVLPFYKNVY